jgi:hypothetical protein
MFSAKRVLVAGLVALAAVVAFWAYGNYQKHAQQQAIAALVGEGTAQLKAALEGTPSAQNIARVDAALQGLRGTRASRQIAMAGAAEAHLVGARTIILRKADAARLAPQAAASRRALAAHMNTPRGRDDSWLRRASELKKKMDYDHAELHLQLRTLADLLYTFPDSKKALSPFLDPSLLPEDSLLEAALKRTQDEAKRAAEEIEKAGRLQR